MLNFEISKEDDDLLSGNPSSHRPLQIHGSPNSAPASSLGSRVQNKLKEYQFLNLSAGPPPGASNTAPAKVPRAESSNRGNGGEQELVNLLSDVAVDFRKDEEERKQRCGGPLFFIRRDWILVFLFVCQLVLFWLYFRGSSSSSSSSSASTAEIESLKAEIAHLRGSSLFTLQNFSDGTTIASINADGIQFSASRSFSVDQAVEDKKRVWSTPTLKVHVGDTVTWHWETNENVVSCDATGLLLPTGRIPLNSGPLSSAGHYSFTFQTPGIYYYTSENSQTMFGVVIAQERQSFVDDKRSRVGPVLRRVPSGIVNNLTVHELETMDGCWVPCYSAPANSFLLDVPFSACTGDWLFVAIAQPIPSGKFVMGAFAKSDIFTRALYDRQSGSSETVYPSASLLENGVYWYSFVSRSPYYYGYGFSSTGGTFYLYSACGFTCSNSYSPSGYLPCTETLTFGNHAATIRGESASSSSFSRIGYTNSCPLLFPPL